MKNDKVVAIIFVIDNFNETKDKWEKYANAGLIPVDVYHGISYGYPDGGWEP